MTTLKTCLFVLAGTLAPALLAQNPAREVADEVVAVPGALSRQVKKQVNLRTVAERGLQQMLDMFARDIEPGTLPQDFPLAVADLESLKDARLGLGYQLHTVAPSRFMVEDDVEPAVTPMDHWHFLVMVHERPVGILEVAKVEGRWEAVSLGAAELAQDVFGMANQHAERGQFRFVRIFQATSDVMEVRSAHEQEPRYVPLVAARETLRLGRPAAFSQMLKGRDLVPHLREAAAKNMTQFHD